MKHKRNMDTSKIKIKIKIKIKSKSKSKSKRNYSINSFAKHYNKDAHPER